MGRIVGQIAKWPREPQNLSLDSGKPPACPLRLEGRSGGLRNPLQSVRGNFRVEQGLGAKSGGGAICHFDMCARMMCADARASRLCEYGATGTGKNQAVERAARRLRGASKTAGNFAFSLTDGR